MSDSDRDSAAWRQTPSAYLATRPARGPIGRPKSQYVAMPGGCRLAVDVYLPPDVPSRVPALLILTPYYRRFALKPGALPDAEACPWRDLFVPRGYTLRSGRGPADDGFRFRQRDPHALWPPGGARHPDLLRRLEAREATLPCYRSEPLDGEVELVGHAVLTLLLGRLPRPALPKHLIAKRRQANGGDFG
jgi:X-Pro dipeptidyl-peptidase (S15 family)